MSLLHSNFKIQHTVIAALAGLYRYDFPEIWAQLAAKYRPRKRNRGNSHDVAFNLVPGHFIRFGT